MATSSVTTDELRRSMSRNGSLVASGSKKAWGASAASIREVIAMPTGGDVFTKSSGREDDDEEELKWAAIERLPTYDRLRKGILTQVLDNGRVVHEEVDVSKLGMQDKKQLLEIILKVIEDDNERFLMRLRDRSDRPGVLTALIGVSGAGKTTLMDVLAGRKTGGYIEGNISISGYPKNQETFARVSGYCEQNDIHSPHA